MKGNIVFNAQFIVVVLNKKIESKIIKLLNIIT